MNIDNCLGEELFSARIKNIKEQISTPELKEGIYMLKLEKDGVVVSRRLLVQ